jgi:hypothetical protein
MVASDTSLSSSSNSNSEEEEAFWFDPKVTV